MEVTVSRAMIRRVLFALLALVSSAGLLVEALKSPLGLSGRRGVVPMLSLSYEQNVPTWYSSALLLVCSWLLALIAADARQKKVGYVRHWWLLAAAFLYISLDETACIHEEASRWFNLGGVLYFGWVIPAGIIVLLLGVLYLRFLWHLPRRTRIQFIVAGAIYVAGALLLELPLGYWTEREGSDNFGYAAIDWVEETMEMLGVTLFLLSLLSYLGAERVALAFPREPAPEAPEQDAREAPEPHP